MPDVIIISTGEELLQGTTVNTNSSFISSLLFGTNFTVLKHIVIGDKIDSIISCLEKSVEEADIIITTGGLGPTDDDNTVAAVSRVLLKDVVIDEESDRKTSSFFQSMELSPSRLDSRMSAVPEGAYIIQNQSGLAPGFIIKNETTTVISIPGVPAEAENMMLYDVIPYLKKEFLFHEGMKLSYRMSGIRESDINTILNDINLPNSLNTGITSKSGVCDLVITGIHEEIISKTEIDLLINKKFENYLLGYNAESPEEELVLILKEKNMTISTAESCTGGLIAKKITDTPGSSAVFKGSIVAYSNEIKENFLDVSPETLNKYGAVSENTAGEMAAGIQKKFGTDISVSTTGIAGPDGGSRIKPVGTVCFGFRINNYQHTFTKTIMGNRDRVRTFSSLYAINFLRDYLKKID
jgi:nicotinamide-nucleotide amidase